jgi:Tol biopolymer transport system component
MTLASGTRLGPYEISSPIGAGGMGEVYRARDTRLDRTVAIKILPAHAASEERRQRFEREARAISSLSHPHICVLHDIGRHEGIDYLVMEYLEGETLADRLRKGALPIDQVLRYGIEIAHALDKAHRHGIVHRDLKPANVMLTKAGAKLLDFGLAKLRAPEVPLSAASELSALPTEDKPLTVEGSLVGTFQYMAPEQLEGKEPDRRADIFAFGAVLYEMATGQRAFKGKSQASLIAAILASEPAPISSVQPLTPPALDRVVAVCLAKDPDERWQSAHDLLTELKWIRDGSAVSPARGPRVASGERIAWVMAVLAAATAGLAVSRWRETARQPPPVIRSAIVAPETASFHFFDGPPVLSPDGRRMAFVALSADGRNRVWVRALDDASLRPLVGTEGALYPFWSPDSLSIGFFTDTKLMRTEVTGGPPQILCEASAGRGGAWSREGTIVFSGPVGVGLFRVSASGGAPAPATRLDAASHETGHRWPFFLPDGRRFLYTVLRAVSSQAEPDAIFLGSLDSEDRRQLVSARSNAVYARPGYLLFVREGALLAQPFDVARGEVTGAAVQVADPVQTFAPVANTAFTVSDTGLLAYQPGTAGEMSQAVWMDRTGRQSDTGIAAGAIGSLRLSHDQKRIAFQMEDRQGRGDLWIHDLGRRISSRFTVDPANDFDPVWSPDDTAIVFSSNRTGGGDLYRKATSGDGTEETIFRSDYRKAATDWSRDGGTIVFNQFGATTRQDLWLLSWPERRARPLLQTSFFESAASLSPDGRWAAYHSDESGRLEVYVRPAASTGARWRISREGGTFTRWRADGKEIFYVEGNGTLMAVDVKLGATFEGGEPRRLFTTRFRRSLAREYDVSPDGQKFLVAVAPSDEALPPITLVQNWTSLLKR